MNLDYNPPPMALVWMREIHEKGHVNTTDGGMADMWLSPQCSLPKENPYVKWDMNPERGSPYYSQYTLTEAGKAYMEKQGHG